MFRSRLKNDALLVTLGLLLGGALFTQTWALPPPDPREPDKPNSDNLLASNSPDQFDKLRSLIKPNPGGFDDLPWMTDLW